MGLRTGLKTGIDYIVPPQVRRVATPVVLMILVLYFYAEGPLIFGSLWASSGFQNAILFYLLLIFGAFMIEVTPLKSGLFKPPRSGLFIQMLVFLGIALLLNAVIYLSGLRVSLGPTDAFIVQVLLFQITVSGAEELFFRGALYKTGPVISSVAFAAFHGLVYGLAIIPLVTAFAAGLAFYYIYGATRDRYGLVVNTAAHFAYNTALLGIFLLGLLKVGCVLFGGAC